MYRECSTRRSERRASIGVLSCHSPAHALEHCPVLSPRHSPQWLTIPCTRTSQWNPREWFKVNVLVAPLPWVPLLTPHCCPSAQVIQSTESGSRSRSAHSTSNTLIWFSGPLLHNAGSRDQLCTRTNTPSCVSPPMPHNLSRVLPPHCALILLSC